MNWSEIPSLSALRAFDAVARHQSLSAAARSLNVTHAAIAQHIRSLEKHLSVQLTQREGRGSRLTPEGEILAGSLAEGFGKIREGIESLAFTASKKPVSVTATPSFSENWLMPRLGAFWAQHPDIMVSVMPSPRVIDLAREPFDLAFRYGKGSWPNTQAEFLVSADYVVAAAPDLIGDCTCFEELLKKNWVFEQIHKEPQRLAEEWGLDLAANRVRIVPTLTMCLSALRAGVGISIVTRTLISEDLREGRLVALQAIPSTGIGYFIVRGPKALSANAETFRTWLLKSV